MVSFTILGLIAAFLIMFTVVTVAAGGAVFISIFADVIVCVALIVWIIRRKKKK